MGGGAGESPVAPLTWMSVCRGEGHCCLPLVVLPVQAVVQSGGGNQGREDMEDMPRRYSWLYNLEEGPRRMEYRSASA